MIAKALLADLLTRDIRLSEAGDKLRVNAPTGALTAELRQILSDRKVELLDALRQRTPGQHLADLSVHFADHADHHAVLSRYCELADEFRQKQGMSPTEAAGRAHVCVWLEYINGDGNG